MTPQPGRSLEQERNDALSAWYRSTARTFSWRQTRDPYAVLVSEVMLQQTQADRVVPYYERFMLRWPTPEMLAAAPLNEVLEAWSGLGYNSRAKRLREAAAAVANEGWPRDVAGLMRLPGIGPYTARAIAAFAFGAHVAAVDTNLRRVLSRWHGEELSPSALRIAADRNLGDDAAEWNQAMMDLGARICRPRAPRCSDCPVEQWCSGPGAYTPPRPQGRFEGSARQLRGAIVRHLVAQAASFGELVAVTGFDPGSVEEALDDLNVEGLVMTDGDSWMIAD
jgi:A/G-specific adenine glycosylase